jgi:hypothetical protein
VDEEHERLHGVFGGETANAVEGLAERKSAGKRSLMQRTWV